ncbi:hypothetical protein [Streptomyces bacillaris]|uniref:hypothetical protein n=1 Tax=Streptomyces bacillaris TaxID=68179 RepID=UPI00365F47B3
MHALLLGVRGWRLPPVTAHPPEAGNAERAEQEGHQYAAERGLRVMEVVTDPYGEPDASRREGWRRVQAMAKAGSISVVLVRWPVVIAPESRHEDRYQQVARLRELGVSVRYTWAPLAASNGEAR